MRERENRLLVGRFGFFFLKRKLCSCLCRYRMSRGIVRGNAVSPLQERVFLLHGCRDSIETAVRRHLVTIEIDFFSLRVYKERHASICSLIKTSIISMMVC